MLTLSFGYKKPQSGDKGPVVFPALEFDIQRLNDHTHNGVDSSPLPPTSSTTLSDTLLPGSWTLVANGIYKQVVTMPAGLTFDNALKCFRLSSGFEAALSVKKLSASQYEVYINDASETVTVLYK